ncbi:MAG: DUF368 domain-containing protein [Saprospiraceae bacterium]|nr:DUF368 domain-containing protein [Saprospiraceae bacterium]
MNLKISTILKGCAMGVAEVIPGVSGGTIAFISGIYETLIDSIKSFDADFFRLLLKGKFVEIWEKINGWFLVSLLSGMVFGILVGIFAITWLLEHYPEPLWGFFFGLVMASAIIISRQVTHWDFKKVASLLIGIGVALFIVTVSPTEGSTHPGYIFVAGMIAISAFILPGISGSFMLLLMGMYTLIIPSLKSIVVYQDMDSFYIISIFAIGCLVGITTFSRVLSWLFHHYRATTFVLLTGFLIGSLYKIWPWRNLKTIVDKVSGVQTEVNTLEQLKGFDMEHMKILSESNVLPMDYWMSSPKTFLTIVSVVIGFLLVFLIEKNSKSENLVD